MANSSRTERLKTTTIDCAQSAYTYAFVHIGFAIAHRLFDRGSTGFPSGTTSFSPRERGYTPALFLRTITDYNADVVRVAVVKEVCLYVAVQQAISTVRPTSRGMLVITVGLSVTQVD